MKRAGLGRSAPRAAGEWVPTAQPKEVGGRTNGRGSHEVAEVPVGLVEEVSLRLTARLYRRALRLSQPPKFRAHDRGRSI